MNKIKTPMLKAIAVFLIGIIISLPVYSSSAIAALSNPHVYGADKIDGYLRRGETIFFNVTAEIPGDTDITPSQVHLVDLSGPEFNACTSIGSDKFACEYMMASSSITGDSFNLNALLYNDNNILVPPRVLMRGAFEQLPPEIRSFAITPPLANGGSVTLQYEIYDHSYSSTDSGRCSGLGSIEFSNGGTAFRTINFSTTPGDCGRTGSITVPISNITGSEGVISVTLAAYDNFEQASSSTAQFIYDTTPSSVDSGSLSITDNAGNSIDYIGNAPISGKVMFHITSQDLDAASVYGDITEINKDSHPEYLHMQAACASGSTGGYNCTFNNIEAKLDQTTNVNIKINMSDLAGNPSSAVLSKTIYFDNTGPSITSVRTASVDSGKSYVGNGLNTFVVEFSEGGIGVDKNSMKLDLSNVRSGLTNKAANECTGSACYWYNITTDKSDGEKTVSVLSSSSDKLGNLITGTLTGNVTVDRTYPVVASSNLSSIGTGTEAIPGKIKTTDEIVLSTEVIEKSALRAYADFSSLVTSQSNESGSCEKISGDRWKCDWTSDPIDVPGMIQATFPVTYVDFAGNTYTQNQQIKVYNYSNKLNPSFWAHSVTCSPPNVDRQVTSLVNYKVLCSINLIPLTADQETLSITMENCNDKIQGSTAYLSSADLINAETGSTNPYISISLSQSEMRIDKISLDCPLNIKTRAGDEIMQYPEIENITVDIGFYSMPLGEFDQSTIQKIRDVEGEIGVGFTWISMLKKILFYAEKICSLVSLWGKIQILWGFIKQIPLWGETVAAPAQAADVAATGFEKILYKFCAYVSCRETLWGDWYKRFAKGGDVEIGSLEGGLKKYGMGSMWPETPKDSLILSIATGCLPGIVYNIEKWRQIQCNYGACLYDSAQNNIPIKACEDQKNYLVCTFVTGQIFQLLPFAWLKGMLEKITYILSDPLALVFALADYIICPQSPAALGGACMIIKGVSVTAQIISDIQDLFDSKSWKIQGDMCEVYFDRLDELGEGEE